MEKNVIIFVCDALISSENQINFIDSQFNPIYGGKVGTFTKNIAEKVKDNLLADKIKYNSVFHMLNDISNICKNVNENNNVVSEFLKLLLVNLSGCLSFSREIQLSPYKNDDNLINKHISDDVIEILDDESEDEPIEYVHKFMDIFSYTSDWISLLKLSLDKIDSKEIFLDRCDQNEIYKSHIFYGFLHCLKFGIETLSEKSTNIVELTNVIENLVLSMRKNDSNSNVDTILFNSDVLPNPVIQIIATSLRAIIEAMKISIS